MNTWRNFCRNSLRNFEGILGKIPGGILGDFFKAFVEKKLVRIRGEIFQKFLEGIIKVSVNKSIEEISAYLQIQEFFEGFLGKLLMDSQKKKMIKNSLKDTLKE